MLVVRELEIRSIIAEIFLKYLNDDILKDNFLIIFWDGGTFKWFGLIITNIRNLWYEMWYRGKTIGSM